MHVTVVYMYIHVCASGLYTVVYMNVLVCVFSRSTVLVKEIARLHTEFQARKLRESFIGEQLCMWDPQEVHVHVRF